MATAFCTGSYSHVTISLSQQDRYITPGFARPNKARDVDCPGCGRRFGGARISYTGPEPMALIPRHHPN